MSARGAGATRVVLGYEIGTWMYAGDGPIRAAGHLALLAKSTGGGGTYTLGPARHDGLEVTLVNRVLATQVVFVTPSLLDGTGTPKNCPT